jgi:hypothetical protein
METFPDNHRAKWTECEINKLLGEVKKRTPFHIIAENHQRTIGAIKFKLIRYAIEEMKDNDNSLSMDYLTKITNLSKEELLEGFKKLNFNYDEDINVPYNDRYQVVINKLDIIDSNLKQIWACIFTGILIQFIIHFKTFTSY